MNKQYVYLVLFLSTLFAGCAGSKKDNLKIWDTFETGQYAIGFRHHLVRDTTRFLADSSYRPVQISFWYPSKESKDHRINFTDYFLLSASEKTDTPDISSDSLIYWYKGLAIQSGVTEQGIDSVFASTLTARENAPLRSGDYPVILIAQGNGHPIFNQVVLCEYLASHGYYVISTPSPTRITGGYTTYEGLVNKAYEQADDLEFARSYIADKYQLPKSKTGIIAYSFGARSALLEVLRYHNIDAFVSWDGGIGNAYGKEWIDYIENFNPSSFKAPLLHLYQGGDKTVKPDFSLIKSFGSVRKDSVKIDSVNHGFFMIRGAADAAFNDFQDIPYPKVKSKYVYLLKETLNFLDNYLKE